jgi:anthranilate synthase component I
MTATPDYLSFAQLAQQYDWVPVARRLLCDSLTPVSAFHRLDCGKGACLFESVIGGEKVGRHSFLAVDPFLELAAQGNQVTIRAGDQSPQVLTCQDPIEFLRERLSNVRVAPVPELQDEPFVAGAIGYAGYDVVRYTEHLPAAPPDDRQLPDLSFSFYDRLVVFDHVTKTMRAIVLVPTRDAKDLPQLYRNAQARLDALITQLGTPKPGLDLSDIPDGEPQSLPLKSNFTQAKFEDAVRQCVEYIRAGDIFQVVISQRLETPIHCDPFEIYRTLRVINPSPFMFFLRTRETTLVGSSPEVMCRVLNNQITVRPLAGTRRRGHDEAEDRRLGEELLNDPKERAEHVMLVDLGRNDVGRVARYGSVQLTDQMVIERYSHVMHITSNVTGQLAPDKDAFDALRACLPAGTVSGAPKVRAMEIIDELEPCRRGPYAGAVGYIDYNGNMDTCIALRTLVVKDQMAYIQAGAGIVADSVPELEYQETLNKARGLLKAIQLTEIRHATKPDR